MTSNKIKVGVIGFSDESKFNKSDAIKAFNDAFDNIKELFPEREIHIVSGLTNMGMPRLAYEEAVRRKWKTVGIAPKQSENYKLFPVDEKIIVGEKFGDESEVFINYINVLIKVGGGKQSDKELKMSIEKNIPIMDMSNYL